MKEIPLNSSAISSCNYDSHWQLLWIRFQSGEHYLYRTIPAAVVQALLAATSKGQYFNSSIRDSFPSERLS